MVLHSAGRRDYLTKKIHRTHPEWLEVDVGDGPTLLKSRAVPQRHGYWLLPAVASVELHSATHTEFAALQVHVPGQLSSVL